MNFNVAEKYGKAYFMPPEVTYDWVKKDAIADLVQCGSA